METTIVKAWQGSKLLIKGVLIGGLALLLMIPAWFVKDMIKEREVRQQEAFAEVSSKWASGQLINPAVLIVPYHEMVPQVNGAMTAVKKEAFLLPEQLDIQATVNPEKRYRGIYEVMLYSSGINIRGHFSTAMLDELKINPDQLLWSEAYVYTGLQDARGLAEPLRMKWRDTLLSLHPTVKSVNGLGRGFTTPVPAAPDQEIHFATSIKLNGSDHLQFIPTGSASRITLRSAWPDPSFNGVQLPDHEVSDSGFVATWNSFAHSRSFPQVWKDQQVSLTEAAVGANFFIPVTAYQKTMRLVKYAALCILLTFAAFFIIETIAKKSAHPFQYALIGLALILFYTLLLSISEYTGFNTAYIIAATATVALISWFVKGVLQSGRFTTILLLILALMYSYIFSILQLQDYSLLLGSIGLFVTLAVVMYFSRKIQW